MKKLEKCMTGAIFTLAGFEGVNELEVFITDWSPCPAASAVAIHPQHKFLAENNVDRIIGDYFTGKYVRHPLNGDLLPVWVAGWVNPGFGTGAVLVNPAHSEVDYTFGRKVGLPIKFALHKEGTTFSPQSWPDPTVIKDGKVVNTSAYDGMTWEEATAAYFENFAAKGLARAYRDVRLPGKVVAKVTPAQEGEYLFDPARCCFSKPSDDQRQGQIPVNVELNPLITTATAFRSEENLELISANSKSKDELTYLACMYFDVTNRDNLAPNYIVGRVEGSADRPKHILHTALLVCSERHDVVVLNNKNIDQVKSLFDVLVKARESLSEEGLEVPDDLITGAASNPNSSFRNVYTWVKETVKENKSISKDSFYALCDSILPVKLEDVC